MEPTGQLHQSASASALGSYSDAKEVDSTAGNLRVRHTDSDTCPPLLKIASGTIIEDVRNERLSSLAIVRFELFETTLDPR